MIDRDGNRRCTCGEIADVLMGGRWSCVHCAGGKGFVFRASNGDWYAVNAQGEQSPSFRTRAKATRYLGS